LDEKIHNSQIHNGFFWKVDQECKASSQISRPNKVSLNDVPHCDHRKLGNHSGLAAI